MSIRSKFILILLFSLAAMAAGIGLAARFQTAREADAAFAGKAAAQLDRVDDIIHLYFKGAEKTAKNLAALPEARNIALARNAPAENGRTPAEAEKALLQRLAALPDLVPGVEAAFCGYKNGSFHSSAAAARPEGYDARAQSWYSNTAWGPAEASVAAVAISDESKSLVATVASKIKDDGGQPLGVAAIVVNLGALTDTLRDVRLGRNGYVVLLDAEGRVLFDPKVQENLLRPASDADSALFSLARLPAGLHELSRGNAALLAFSRILPDTRWKAAVLADKTEQAAPSSRTFLSILLAALFSCLVLAVVGALFSFGATRPLYALIRQSKALAEGNDEALGGIAGRGPDIAELQGNIGQLTGRVMLLVQAEKERAGAMEAYARKAVAGKTARVACREASRNAALALAPLAAEAGKEAAAFAAWAGKLHDLARVQALAASNVRTATANLSDAADTIARQAAETEKNAEAALDRTRKADKLARDTARALKTMEDAAKTLAPGLEALKTKTVEMAAVTVAVRDLAEAINVLGLKVSVEVSSAGETGRKFAPMAEEMRTLAEKAMAAASAMDNAVAASAQAHTAHSLAVNKNAAAVKRAAANAAKTGNELAGAAAAANATVGQVSVLATALEGMAQAEALSAENAGAILRAARDMGGAVKDLDAAAVSLAAFAARFTALSEDFAAAPDGNEPFLAAPRAYRTRQKQLD